MLLAQETRATQEMVPALSAWALKRGWKAVIAPAVRGEGGGPSAGVAIFARAYLGLQYPYAGGYIWHQGRAVAAVVEAPGHLPMLVSSLYLHPGAGPDVRNMALLANVAKAIEMQDGEWNVVIGGDMNMPPEALVDTGIDRKMGASVVHPVNPRGTFSYLGELFPHRLLHGVGPLDRGNRHHRNGGGVGGQRARADTHEVQTAGDVDEGIAPQAAPAARHRESLRPCPTSPELARCQGGGRGGAGGGEAGIQGL